MALSTVPGGGYNQACRYSVKCVLGIHMANTHLAKSKKLILKKFNVFGKAIFMSNDISMIGLKICLTIQ
jgi:hypothetical protein